MKARTLWALAGACAILAACGGGDGDAPVVGGGGGTGGGSTTPTSAIGGLPQSAQDSVTGLVAYLQDLIGNSTSDSSEPISLEGVTLPVSDTTEPAAI